MVRPPRRQVMSKGYSEVYTLCAVISRYTIYWQRGTDFMSLIASSQFDKTLCKLTREKQEKLDRSDLY